MVPRSAKLHRTCSRPPSSSCPVATTVADFSEVIEEGEKDEVEDESDRLGDTLTSVGTFGLAIVPPLALRNLVRVALSSVALNDSCWTAIKRE